MTFFGAVSVWQVEAVDSFSAGSGLEESSIEASSSPSSSSTFSSSPLDSKFFFILFNSSTSLNFILTNLSSSFSKFDNISKSQPFQYYSDLRHSLRQFRRNHKNQIQHPPHLLH